MLFSYGQRFVAVCDSDNDLSVTGMSGSLFDYVALCHPR